MSVQSGSMVPAFYKGDLVVVKSVPNDGYRVGDVITFANPRNENQTITHRVQSILPADDMQPQRFVTKGDANIAADSPIYGRKIVGKVTTGIPYLGYGFDFVRQPIGLLLLIYVPALIVIAAEIRRLSKYYKEQEPYVAAGFDPSASAQKPSKAKPAFKTSAAAVIVATAIAAPAAHAALMSTATLTSTSISTAQVTLPAAPAYPLISNVTFGNSAGTTNGANINVSTNNPQTATSGNTSVNNNGSGGSAASGNASNSSNTTITINVGGSSTPATVTIYNPTNQAIDLSGWRLADNNTSRTLPAGTTIAAKGSYVYTWPVSNGLSRTSDRLILSNPAGSAIDGLSWGSDTSQFNPSITATAATISLNRSNPNSDTNTTADWQTTP